MLDNDSRVPDLPWPSPQWAGRQAGWLGRGTGVLPVASPPDAGRDDSGPTISGQIHLVYTQPFLHLGFVATHPQGITRSGSGPATPWIWCSSLFLHASSILIENVRAHALSGSEPQTDPMTGTKAHGRMQSCPVLEMSEVAMYPGTRVPQGLSCVWGPVFSLEDC